MKTVLILLLIWFIVFVGADIDIKIGKEQQDDTKRGNRND